MKTEFEIASAISNYVTSQQGVTDFPVTLKQISDEVDTLRVRLITEADTKGLLRRPFLNYTQTIRPQGVQVQLSASRVRYCKIPRLFVLSSGKPAIAYCGAFAGDFHFRVVHGLQREWHKADRWIGSSPTVAVIESEAGDGHILEFRNISPNKFRFTAIFEDPSDLEPYGYDGSTTSQEGGTLYPMPSGEVDIIIGKTAEAYLRTMYRVPLQPNQTVDAPNMRKAAI